ncbi:hypothetical protein ACE01N_19510 [Saccharicrinis sp. FJH2]|uniref:hypothetical protein n=1 Tax=Saccharicrinis sp. FJH65 TaxID=3344659 RepID=UPI0035F2755C
MKSEFLSTKPIEEIKTQLNELTNKPEDKRNLLYTGKINYKKINVSKNKFSYEQNLSIINPFRGFGKISFDLFDSGSYTKINIDIETYTKYGIVFSILLFFLIAIPVLIIEYIFSFQNIIEFGLLILVIFSLISGSIYLSYIWNRNRLEDLSKQILSDLEIELKNSSS